jgi:hypothetical protein
LDLGFLAFGAALTVGGWALHVAGLHDLVARGQVPVAR